MYPRHITPRVLAALADTPVTLINGARQTGKSTLAQQLCAGEHPARYVTLDDATALSAARADASGFLTGFSGPVAIDEVQRAPQLFPAIKAAVDRERSPGRFLLTGSADVLLLPGLSESLAGRLEIVTLRPLSQGEKRGVREDFVDGLLAPDKHPAAHSESRDSLLADFVRGGYPEAMARDSDKRRDAWFGAYVTTILQRDVRDIAHIAGLTELPRLLALLAARAGTLLSFAELSRASAIPQSTLNRYMSLLETTFLVQPLPAWSGNLGKRLVKAPKIFLNDTGLAAYLLGVNAARLRREPALLGRMFESFVVQELRKQLAWSETRASMFHYRSQTGQEVDVILERPDGTLAGIEIKAGSSVSAADFKGLRSLAEALGKRFLRGVVLYAGESAISFGPRLHAWPISALWSGTPAAAPAARRR